MENSPLLTLLHISDSAFPTGAFGHSFGLEYAITAHWINTPEDLLQFSSEVCCHTLLYGDRIFIVLAYKAALSENFQRIKELDEICRAYRPSLEAREASAQIGRSFLSLVADVYSCDTLGDLKTFILDQEEGMPVQHPLAWGAAGALLGLDLKSLVISYLSGFFRQWAQVAVRILPLGQRDSQIYLQKMNQYLQNCLENMTFDVTLDDVSQCSLGYDTAQMGHESLNARYFRS